MKDCPRLLALHISFMRAMLFALALAIVPAAASAGPPDSLFERLKSAQDEGEASDLAQDIWAIWSESGSPTADLLMERALASAYRGETGTAHELLDRAILLKPDFAEAWHRRAGLFLIEENYAEALRDLNEAIRHEPRHFGAWTAMARIFERLGASQEALQSYREALKIYPLMPQARQGEARLGHAAEGVDL